MDNYTLIQNAARSRSAHGHTGFASLSRVDQADRWAAWQASAAPEDYTYSLEPSESEDMQSEPVSADTQMPAQAPEPPKRSFALYNEIAARHNQVFGRIQ